MKKKLIKVNNYQIHEMLPLGLGTGFPGGSDSEESACNAGDQHSVPGSGRSPGKANGNPCKEIQAVHSKENQSWISIGRTDAKAETPTLWPPDSKNQLVGKASDAAKDWRQEEKGMTEDEMVGWHHWLNGHEFEQAPGVDDGQGSLACCSPWGRKKSDTTEQLKWTALIFLPRECHGQRSLKCYNPWGHKELDMTEHTRVHF